MAQSFSVSIAILTKLRTQHNHPPSYNNRELDRPTYRTSTAQTDADLLPYQVILGNGQDHVNGIFPATLEYVKTHFSLLWSNKIVKPSPQRHVNIFKREPNSNSPGLIAPWSGRDVSYVTL